MGGPPGSGKTLQARGVPSILPPMSFDKSLIVTKIYSVAGQLPGDMPLIRHRPYRAPHHTISFASLECGGKVLGPGEISLTTWARPSGRALPRRNVRVWHAPV
jgi:magnesium chelatase family protein